MNNTYLKLHFDFYELILKDCEHLFPDRCIEMYLILKILLNQPEHTEKGKPLQENIFKTVFSALYFGLPEKI